MRDSRRQVLTGTVISDRMDKTVVVQVETMKQHPRYKKYIRRRKNYKAHDEANDCRLGDTVRMMSTRPISKDKRWRVVEIVRRKYVSTDEIVETDELVMKKDRQDNTPKAVAEEAPAAEEQAPEAEEAPEEKVQAEAAEETQEAEESAPEETAEAEEEAQDAAPAEEDDAEGDDEKPGV